MNKLLWKYKTGGIPDEMFIRGKVPMTKAEVRAVTISKARLMEHHVVWDIGAGTGSISVEAALQAGEGEVFAVEKEEDAVELIRKNKDLFGILNLRVLPGIAPEALQGLPQPDRVFIGGSGGNLKQIMALADEQLPAGGRIVVNAVVLETLIHAVEFMQAYNYEDTEITQISVAKTVDLGKLHMFKSQNPVFIISGEKKQ